MLELFEKCPLASRAREGKKKKKKKKKNCRMCTPLRSSVTHAAHCTRDREERRTGRLKGCWRALSPSHSQPPLDSRVCLHLSHHSVIWSKKTTVVCSYRPYRRNGAILFGGDAVISRDRASARGFADALLHRVWRWDTAAVDLLRLLWAPMQRRRSCCRPGVHRHENQQGPPPGRHSRSSGGWARGRPTGEVECETQ